MSKINGSLDLLLVNNIQIRMAIDLIVGYTMINGDIKMWIANTLSFSDLTTYQSNFDQTLHFSINKAFAEVFGKSIKYADMTIRGIYNDISIRVI